MQTLWNNDTKYILQVIPMIKSQPKKTKAEKAAAKKKAVRKKCGLKV